MPLETIRVRIQYYNAKQQLYRTVLDVPLSVEQLYRSSIARVLMEQHEKKLMSTMLGKRWKNAICCSYAVRNTYEEYWISDTPQLCQGCKELIETEDLKSHFFCSNCHAIVLADLTKRVYSTEMNAYYGGYSPEMQYQQDWDKKYHRLATLKLPAWNRRLVKYFRGEERDPIIVREQLADTPRAKSFRTGQDS